jgi:hypothetical protein
MPAVIQRLGALLLAAASYLQAPAPAELQWPKPDLFWYRVTIPNGNLWMSVDAKHGVREPLFDHQRLAIELNLRSGYEFTPATLPFADPAAEFVVKFDGSNAYIQEGAKAIEFVMDGNLWRCELQIKWNWNLVPPTDYECGNRRPHTPRPAAPRPAAIGSPDGRWDAVVVEHNVGVRKRGTDAPVFMLSKDGIASAPYSMGSIVWSTDSRRVTAYRVDAKVSQSTAVAGNVAPLVVRGEWPVPAAAATLSAPAAGR